MAPFGDCDGDDIPEIKSDAFTISGNTLFSVEEFGRKWYERGVEAGLAQATAEAEDLASTVASENEEETIDTLNDENRELKRQVEELKKQVEELKAYEDVAIYARDSLDTANSKMREFWYNHGGNMMSKTQTSFNEIWNQLGAFCMKCSEMMKKADGKGR